MRVIKELCGRQVAQNWSDAEMARELGMPRSNWTAAKLLTRRPTIPFLRRVLRRYPELVTVVLAYLLEDTD